MSGLRAGYVACPARYKEAVCHAQRFSTLGVNTYLQAGAEAALRASRTIVLPIVGKLAVRREKAEKLLRSELPRLTFRQPRAGYYVWVNVESYLGTRAPDGTEIKTDNDLRRYLRQHAKVGVVHGTSCGMSGYFRLTFAIDEADFAAGVLAMKMHLGRLAR